MKLKHPWEQSRLNILSAAAKDRIAIVPYREFTGPDGRMLCHMWTPTGEDNRTAVMREKLREALVLHGLLRPKGIFDWF